MFYGSNIDSATSTSGERYADSENAFAYRKALRADCTCNGRDSAGLAPVDLTLDTSLRSGDVIATTDGLVAYSGVRVGNGQTAEFTPVASYPGLTAEVRARLGEMKVAPVSADTIADDTCRSAATYCPPRCAEIAVQGTSAPKRIRSENSSLRGAKHRETRIVRIAATLKSRIPGSLPRIARNDARNSRFAHDDEVIHRPTMTPITFGADRYFSSIAARAAARFSGVSSPRFSARIIQQ